MFVPMECPDHPLILEQISEEVYCVNRAYRITYVNKNAHRNLFSGADVIGLSIFEVFRNLRPESSTIVNAFETGKPVVKQLTNFIISDGTRKISLTTTVPVTVDGVVDRVVEISEDITGMSNLSKQLIFNKLQQKRFAEGAGEDIARGYYTLDSIIGESAGIQNMKELVSLYAASSANVLLFGESGTGKEMVAQSLFSLSMDPSKSDFVAQNCAAIPETLLESTLFGTEKGAFTGAESRPGLFELAQGGVLFLDEINSMPLSFQAKILRVLQEGRLRRVGGTREISVGFRLICSTNVPPERLLSEGIMREDLYYRLNVLSLVIPSLRERREDIPLLIHHFLEELNRGQARQILGFDQPSLEMLTDYRWPGNVRELRNVVQRSMALSRDKVIHLRPDQFRPFITTRPRPAPEEPFLQGGRILLKEVLRDTEIRVLKAALNKSGGNIAKAARELDIPQQTLNSKVDRFRLRPYICSLVSRES